MEATEQSPPVGRGTRKAALLLACHPGPTAAVTAMVTALAVTSGQGPGACATVAAAALAGQLSVGWCNDAFDARRDTAAGRREKPVAAGAVSARTVWIAAFAALLLCVPLSLARGVPAGAAHLLGVASAWAYNLRLKATPLSWLPYAVGFAALPSFVALGLPGRPWPAWWVVTAGALLGVGAHLANVLPDIEDDLAEGVRGWPQRLGPARARLLLPLPLVAASALLAFARPGPLGVAGGLSLTLAVTATAVGALLGLRRPKAPFLASIAVAAVDVAMLLWCGAAIT